MQKLKDSYQLERTIKAFRDWFYQKYQLFEHSDWGIFGLYDVEISDNNITIFKRVLNDNDEVVVDKMSMSDFFTGCKTIGDFMIRVNELNHDKSKIETFNKSLPFLFYQSKINEEYQLFIHHFAKSKLELLIHSNLVNSKEWMAFQLYVLLKLSICNDKTIPNRYFNLSSALFNKNEFEFRQCMEVKSTKYNFLLHYDKNILTASGHTSKEKPAHLAFYNRHNEKAVSLIQFRNLLKWMKLFEQGEFEQAFHHLTSLGHGKFTLNNDIEFGLTKIKNLQLQRRVMFHDKSEKYGKWHYQDDDMKCFVKTLLFSIGESGLLAKANEIIPLKTEHRIEQINHNLEEVKKRLNKFQSFFQYSSNFQLLSSLRLNSNDKYIFSKLNHFYMGAFLFLPYYLSQKDLLCIDYAEQFQDKSNDIIVNLPLGGVPEIYADTLSEKEKLAIIFQYYQKGSYKNILSQFIDEKTRWGDNIIFRHMISNQGFEMSGQNYFVLKKPQKEFTSQFLIQKTELEKILRPINLSTREFNLLYHILQNEMLNDVGTQGTANAFSLLNCATLKLDHLIDAQQSANPKQKEFLIWFYKMFWVSANLLGLFEKWIKFKKAYCLLSPAKSWTIYRISKKITQFLRNYGILEEASLQDLNVIIYHILRHDIQKGDIGYFLRLSNRIHEEITRQENLNMKNKLQEYSKVQFDEYRDPIIKKIDGKDFLFYRPCRRSEILEQSNLNQFCLHNNYYHEISTLKSITIFIYQLLENCDIQEIMQSFKDGFISKAVANSKSMATLRFDKNNDAYDLNEYRGKNNHLVKDESMLKAVNMSKSLLIDK